MENDTASGSRVGSGGAEGGKKGRAPDQEPKCEGGERVRSSKPLSSKAGSVRMRQFQRYKKIEESVYHYNRESGATGKGTIVMKVKISKKNEVSVSLSSGSTCVTNVDDEEPTEEQKQVSLGENTLGVHQGLVRWLRDCGPKVSRALGQQIGNTIELVMKEQNREPAADGSGDGETSTSRDNAKDLSSDPVKEPFCIPESGADDATLKQESEGITELWMGTCMSSVGESVPLCMLPFTFKDILEFCSLDSRHR